MKNIPKIFDKSYIKAIRAKTLPLLPPHDFLHREIESKLMDRLKDFNRSFESILLIGAKTNIISDYLIQNFDTHNRVYMDLAFPQNNLSEYHFVQADEENLPFAPNSFDLIISMTHLHMTNDIPGALKQFYHCLKKDGLFLSALFGGDTLFELKESFYKAEMNISGKISPRIIPMIEVKQWGDLIKRAGFALPISTEDRVEVSYPHPRNLLLDLKKMGEINTLAERSKSFLERKVFNAMIQHYQNHFSIEDSQILASFDVIMGNGIKV